MIRTKIIKKNHQLILILLGAIFISKLVFAQLGVIWLSEAENQSNLEGNDISISDSDMSIIDIEADHCYLSDPLPQTCPDPTLAGTIATVYTANNNQLIVRLGQLDQSKNNESLSIDWQHPISLNNYFNQQYNDGNDLIYTEPSIAINKWGHVLVTVRIQQAVNTYSFISGIWYILGQLTPSSYHGGEPILKITWLTDGPINDRIADDAPYQHNGSVDLNDHDEVIAAYFNNNIEMASKTNNHHGKYALGRIINDGQTIKWDTAGRLLEGSDDTDHIAFPAIALNNNQAIIFVSQSMGKHYGLIICLNNAVSQLQPSLHGALTQFQTWFTNQIGFSSAVESECNRQTASFFGYGFKPSVAMNDYGEIAQSNLSLDYLQWLTFDKLKQVNDWQNHPLSYNLSCRNKILYNNKNVYYKPGIAISNESVVISFQSNLPDSAKFNNRIGLFTTIKDLPDLGDGCYNEPWHLTNLTWDHLQSAIELKPIDEQNWPGYYRFDAGNVNSDDITIANHQFYDVTFAFKQQDDSQCAQIYWATLNNNHSFFLLSPISLSLHPNEKTDFLRVFKQTPVNGQQLQLILDTSQCQKDLNINKSLVTNIKQALPIASYQQTTNDNKGFSASFTLPAGNGLYQAIFTAQSDNIQLSNQDKQVLLTKSKINKTYRFPVQANSQRQLSLQFKSIDGQNMRLSGVKLYPMQLLAIIRPDDWQACDYSTSFCQQQHYDYSYTIKGLLPKRMVQLGVRVKRPLTIYDQNNAILLSGNELGQQKTAYFLFDGIADQHGILQLNLKTTAALDDAIDEIAIYPKEAVLTSMDKMSCLEPDKIYCVTDDTEYSGVFYKLAIDNITAAFYPRHAFITRSLSDTNHWRVKLVDGQVQYFTEMTGLLEQSLYYLYISLITNENHFNQVLINNKTYTFGESGPHLIAVKTDAQGRITVSIPEQSQLLVLDQPINLYSLH